MAECKVQHAEVSLTLSLTLGEGEARALEALAGYGTDAFLEVFYEKMGKATSSRTKRACARCSFWRALSTGTSIASTRRDGCSTIRMSFASFAKHATWVPDDAVPVLLRHPAHAVRAAAHS
jgi:hypothetical protein